MSTSLSHSAPTSGASRTTPSPCGTSYPASTASKSPACDSAHTTSCCLVTNQLMTCGSGPDPVSPEPSPTYDHLPDRRPATRTRRASAPALADPTPRSLIHGALSARPDVASAPALIRIRPRDLPRPSAGVPLRGTSSGFSHHVGSVAAVPLPMTPVRLVLTPVRLTDSIGLTPIVPPER
jgi:hypothetical protein